jgi:peptide/nickel transport system permease protein
MLEVIRSDYMTTARSKGISEMRVIIRHGMQNAMIPILTVAGGLFSSMLGGSLILEQIFSIPGIGSYIITAVGNRDYPIIRSGSLVLAVAFGIVILIVDLLYAFVDQRIRAQYSKKGAKK